VARDRAVISCRESVLLALAARGAHGVEDVSVGHGIVVDEAITERLERGLVEGARTGDVGHGQPDVVDHESLSFCRQPNA
jgi:hypothetical protein